MKLTVRSRRVTQIALFAIALSLAILNIAWWQELWESSAERIEVASNNIAHTEWIVSHQAQIETRLQQEKLALLGYNQTYVEADSQERASAELQKRIKQAVSDVGGSISSAQPISFQSKAKVAAARFRIAVPGPKIGDFLYKLEMQLPFLFIDEAEISRNTSGPAADAGGAALLTMQLDAHSYWLDGNDAK